MPKFPLFSLLAALAVISSFSVAAMAEDGVATETSVTSHATAVDEHKATVDGKTTIHRQNEAATNSVKLHSKTDADMTVDDEE